MLAISIAPMTEATISAIRPTIVSMTNPPAGLFIGCEYMQALANYGPLMPRTNLRKAILSAVSVVPATKTSAF